MQRLYNNIVPTIGLSAAIMRLRMTLHRFHDSRRAVTAIEYVIIASLIAVVIVGSVRAVGSKLPASFNTVSSEL